MVGRTDMTTLSGWRAARSRLGALDDCCLVIATYNRHAEIVRLLDSLITLAGPPAEVVVVDGHPSRELGGILREWSSANPAPFELIYVESPSGLTRQRNVGVDISTREYVFFLDDDAVPLPGYFFETRRAFQGDYERRVGGIAGCVMNEMDRPVARRWQLRFALGLVPRLEPMIYHPSGTHTPRSLLKPFSGVRRIDVMPGCAWTFRREVFETRTLLGLLPGLLAGRRSRDVAARRDALGPFFAAGKRASCISPVLRPAGVLYARPDGDAQPLLRLEAPLTEGRPATCGRILARYRPARHHGCCLVLRAPLESTAARSRAGHDPRNGGLPRGAAAL